jgi:hypothetical protein
MDNNELLKFMRKQMRENKKNKKEDAWCNDKEDDVVRKSFGGFGEEKGENRKLQFKRNLQVRQHSVLIHWSSCLRVTVYLTALTDIQGSRQLPEER